MYTLTRCGIKPVRHLSVAFLSIFLFACGGPEDTSKDPLACDRAECLSSHRPLPGCDLDCGDTLPEPELEPSLVNNGGLEMPDDLSMPTGWRQSSGEAISRSHHHYAGKYGVATSATQSGVSLIASDPVSVSGGAYYSFSVWYYQPSGTAYITGARLEVHWLDAEGMLLHQHILEGTAIGAWTKLGHRVLSPSLARYAVVSIGRTASPTTVYLDEVALTAN